MTMVGEGALSPHYCDGVDGLIYPDFIYVNEPTVSDPSSFMLLLCQVV